jgi:hypothetical protein
MSPSLLENIEVSAGFFILDAVLVAILLPLILTILEKRKWAPMRRELVKRCHGYYRDCAVSAGFMGYECILFLYVELCSRCAEHHRATMLYTMTPPTAATLRRGSRYKKEQDLTSLAKAAHRQQREARSRFERYINIFSASIDSEMAPVITAVYEAGDAVTTHVWSIASALEMNEHDPILQQPPYVRTSDAYNSFGAVTDIYNSLKRMHSGIREISTTIGGVTFDPIDFDRALSQARENAEACRLAVLELFKLLGQDPPKSALTPIA